MANLPVLSKGESPSLWGVGHEDVGMKSETDGGYVFTRPRHTRKPRRTFSTGWMDMNQTDFDAMENFFDIVGAFTAFNYVNYMKSDEIVNVRFAEPPKYSYEGVGATKRYTIKIKIEEV